MELRDFIVTPLILMLIYFVAYVCRPLVTDSITRRYYFPALTLKIFGAIALGLLYQFHYGGGDTFNYHTYGSRQIWNVFVDSPYLGIKMFLSNGEISGDTFKYAVNIPFYADPSSFFIVRISFILDLITFSTYSATAALFGALGFSGMWAFFILFYKYAPHQHRWIAFATLFIPSVVFWGSGIMKDTVTITFLGFLTYAIHTLFIKNKFSISSVLLLVLSIWVIFSVKKYILMCFFPAAFMWIYSNRLLKIKSTVLRILVVPLVVAMLVSSAYFSVRWVGQDDPKYAIDKLAETSQITAYDIGFYTGRDAGSGYDLGELDGTFSGMIKLLPQAINVSLFRPYIWEVRNPLMVLSALESLALFCVTLYMIFRFRMKVFRALLDSNVLFCLVFSLTFAFAVGVSTFNFGTLARYKIPLLPFYVLAITFISEHVNRSKKIEALEEQNSVG